jgi:hypothetical protein
MFASAAERSQHRHNSRTLPEIDGHFFRLHRHNSSVKIHYNLVSTSLYCSIESLIFTDIHSNATTK